jgi:hypothetical protein
MMMGRSSAIERRKMRKRKARAEPTDEYDSPWKEAIERFFPDFCHFFFPEIAERIEQQSVRRGRNGPPADAGNEAAARG